MLANSWEIARNNLTSVAVLVFVLGFLAARLRSDVRIPDPVYHFISIYLLFGIGLKGGHALKDVAFSTFIAPALATIALGLVIPVIAFLVLGFIKKLTALDRGAMAAHYGSTSLVTFSAALLFLENNHIKVEGFATALLTLLEIPGIIVGIYLGSRHNHTKVSWSGTLREVLTGKTIVLLVAGLAIGAITSNSGFEKVTPFFINLQSGMLALFLLHLGCIAGNNVREIKDVGFPVAIFAIFFPIFSAALGAAMGHWVGLSLGGSFIVAVLCASASYIAAPAAVSVALPESKSSLALMSSIGLTFPFNLVFGIPIYHEMARWIS